MRAWNCGGRPWRGSTLEIAFGASGHAVGLEIDEQFIPGTLQTPRAHLRAGQTHRIRLAPAPQTPLLLRSSVPLEEVERAGTGTGDRFTAFGLAHMTFSAPLPCRWTQDAGLHTCWFEHFGQANLVIGNS